MLIGFGTQFPIILFINIKIIKILILLNRKWLIDQYCYYRHFINKKNHFEIEIKSNFIVEMVPNQFGNLP